MIIGDFVWSVAAANANGNNAVGLFGVLMMLAIVLPVAVAMIKFFSWYDES